ncbi:MAG: hypothetical protein CMF42_03520 [Legionellales bacterium]|nr:hypothetical protein [Legionellales bacterium]
MFRLKKNDKNVNTLRSNIRYAVLIMNKEPLTIYTPVLRSSGDVYHIAAFLILNDLYDYDVFFAYDQTTLSSVQRSIYFLQQLGYKANLGLIDSQAHHYYPRHKDVRSYLRQGSKKAIDQRMLTLMISTHILKDGKKTVTQKIKEVLLDPKYLKVQQSYFFKITDWIREIRTSVIKQLNQRPFVILHHRCSKYANKQQTLEDFWGKYKLFLKSIDYTWVMIMVSDQPNRTHDQCIYAFGPKGIPSVLEKFCHIHLIHTIAALPHCLGIVGSTSGTLDILALTGLNIVNIHLFSKTTAVGNCSNQDFRLLSQSLWQHILPKVVVPEMEYFKLVTRCLENSHYHISICPTGGYHHFLKMNRHCWIYQYAIVPDHDTAFDQAATLKDGTVIVPFSQDLRMMVYFLEQNQKLFSWYLKHHTQKFKSYFFSEHLPQPVDEEIESMSLNQCTISNA